MDDDDEHVYVYNFDMRCMYRKSYHAAKKKTEHCGVTPFSGCCV